MKRREFMTLLGSAAAAWPLFAGAQQGENIRRICVLTAGVGADDPDAQAGNDAFVPARQQLGWTSGCNLRIDYFWGSGQDDLAARARASGRRRFRHRRAGAMSNTPPVVSRKPPPL